MNSFSLMRPEDEYERVLRQREIDGFAFYKKFSREFVNVSCPACGAEGEYAFQKYGFSHQLCPSCMTLYCSPRPSDNLIAHYYNTFEAPQLWTRLLLKADRQRKILQHTPRVDKIIGIIRSRCKDGGTALDLGAGSGAFSSCLKNTGFFDDVIALDISESCVTACRNSGLSARKGTISDIEDRTMNLICMNDLIEHVFDPKELLADCARVLHHGGFISIATPNGEGFDFKILKENTKNITPPEHINYFNPGSIEILLERTGFIPVAIETPGILDVEIILKEKRAGFPLKTRNEYLDYLLERDDSVQKRFQDFLTANRLSSHMLVIARKE